MSSPGKGVYNPKAVILHAALLDRACAHCRKSLAAASRRSLGRVAVPVWLVVLTDQLPVSGLVGHYPANNLMGRTPVPAHLAAFVFRPYPGLARRSARYPPPGGWFVRATQPSPAPPPRGGRAF